MNLRRMAIPLSALALCWLALLALVLGTAEQLPAKVATHFDLHGVPNGWMSRSGHIGGMLGVGFGLSIFVLAIFAFMRCEGGSLLNLPHKAYWLAPERAGETLDDLFSRGVWLCCLLVLFDAGLHWAIVQANRSTPAALSHGYLGWQTGLFFTALAIWFGALLFRFLRKP